MMELSSDPANLFASPPPSTILETTPPILPKPKLGAKFYIQAPILPAELKKLYKPSYQTSLKEHDDKFPEVMRKGTDLAHKVRVKSKITAKNVLATDKGSRNHRDDVVSDSQDEYEDEIKQDSSDDDYESGDQLNRRPTRTRRNAGLPFSPRKLRLRNVYTVNDSSESDSEASPALRRLRRAKPVKLSVGFESPLSVSSDRRILKPRSKSRTKKDKRKKSIKTGYGHVHDVSDIECESDDDFSPLRRHRDICEKCHEQPAHDLLKSHNQRPKGKSSRKKVVDEFEETEDEVERMNSLGGWVRCLNCPVVAHWKCLANSQRDEILKAMKEKETVEQAKDSDAPESLKLKKRSSLGIRESTDFICGTCMKGGTCMGCMDVIVIPHVGTEGATTVDTDVAMVDVNAEQRQKQLLFRCFTCRRPSHNEHLPRPASLPSDASVADIAEYYQSEKGWLCADCSSYVYKLDNILAWRPYPPGAIESSRSPDEPPNYKDPLPREYLVKWIGRSYRRTTWVPHMWLLSTNQAKLQKFVTSGARVQLRQDDRRSGLQEEDELLGTAPDALIQEPLSLNAFPDAEQHIPLAWKTVNRVLDVLLWHPKSNGAERSKATRMDSDVGIQSDLQVEYDAIFESGKQPSARNTETLAQWKMREDRSITVDDIGDVVWVFIKWDGLHYGEATWDSPPRPGDVGYEPFAKAFARYVQALDVRVPKYTNAQLREFKNRPKDEYRLRHCLRDAAKLQLGQSPELQLLPFQVDGFNWLCNNWWNRQPCILADEMGLGKTVQIATFLGNIATKYDAMPALIVVPNSTVTNWVRELERWAPNLRVVSYYGGTKAREVIRKFELYHEKAQKGFTKAKFHVLVATYEMLLIKAEFSSVFKSERWEVRTCTVLMYFTFIPPFTKVLVVDEGQRIKSDASLLFKRLNELDNGQRIIMTGTPLNNNMRELFNLMNFLDPQNWNDLDALENEYETLTEDLVKELHNRLRPYFLRRTKGEVLQLPPKNEVIVPVSMAPLQREVYRSILSHNVDILRGLTRPANSKSTIAKKNINNILMQLRKCLQHPYLYDDSIEPRDLPPKETHGKLIDASAKLRLLKMLLPKLKARGHRVLLFSQFVIALDVIEDFLEGEGFKFLRLDGNTKNLERQNGMDEFNRPGSDVFIYLLSTRAGGVGINLYTADTVIIFDPDFNPHQDLQAISRAYRYGQKKTCLVFKLMVKDSAEDRIMQIGKKKLVLDHLIVQKMDDEDSVGEDVQSILTFGAKKLFETEQGSGDIIYSDQDIDKLIEKTELEGEKQEEVKEGAFSFSFAKLWATDKDAMEEMQDDDQIDSWTHTLQKITAEREKSQIQEIAASGRGVRRAAASHKPNYVDGGDGSPARIKKKPKSKSVVSDTSSYSTSENQSDESEKSDAMDVDSESLLTDKKLRKKLHYLNGALMSLPTDKAECGLCGQVHGESGECFMTDKSEYLAEYRDMLIQYADDEPWDDRSAAIRAIDETLYKRGHLGLIAGQPLHPLRAPPMMPHQNSQLQGSLKRPGSPAEETLKKKSKPMFRPEIN
ncbi:hypothetical protein APHAL10511_006087 [Amanita phalloides]|nr:hypothetical protein APHAL10511_006087 [Amanita phalloides]